MAAGSTIQFAKTGSDAERLVFSGPPQQLRGNLRVVNSGDSKQKLSQVTVESSSLLGPARIPLTNIGIVARLLPGQQASIQSMIQLDPQTPPGSYDFTVKIDGESVQATAHVTDVVDFRMEPSSISLIVGSDESYERTFVIENAGNVPLLLGERCEAPLVDSIDLKTSMLQGLHEALSSELKEKMEAWLDRWGERAGGMLAITREPITLRPGQKITATATFHVPAGLAPFRAYNAELQLYNAQLSVTIYTTRNAGSEKPEELRSKRR